MLFQLLGDRYADKDSSDWTRNGLANSVICMECQGHEERISPKDRCKSCNGRKIVREKKILEVHIDKGMKDGQKITFKA